MNEPNRTEYRRFTCRKYRVTSNFTYIYKDNKLVSASCSLKNEKQCNEIDESGRKCPLIGIDEN